MDLLTLDIKYEQDLSLARRRSRQVAAAVGLDSLDQTRLATAVSELGRNALEYAGGGRLTFSVIDAEDGRRQALRIQVLDEGPGIPHLDQVLSGSYRSSTGMGQGLLGTRRMVDSFEIAAPPGAGTRVTLGKWLARGARPFGGEAAAALTARIDDERAHDAFGELRHQNQELLAALAVMRAQREEIAELNRALEARGVALAQEVAASDEARRAADEANRAKSHFLSVISHELRTPLGAILGYARLMEMGLVGSLTDGQREYIDRIVAAQVHLCRLSDDLLAFAKLGSGTLALDCGPVSVRDICRATEQLTEPQLAERALHFSSRCADGALFVLADASKVQQILLNLVANAMKFTAAGGTISLEATADAAFVSVAVRDTGVGIPADKLAAIFEPFVQLEKYPQSRSGVGLGLSISRELARAMHGDLTVASEVGEGSTFTLLLPRLAD